MIPIIAGWEFLHYFKSTYAHDLDRLQKMAQQHNWLLPSQKCHEALKKHKAVVATNKNKQIIYTNCQFENLTGYSSQEIYMQSPRILQGQDTSIETIIEIQKALASSKKYAGEIINYKKSGKCYLCIIEIYPIYDIFHALNGFIAFEQEG